jgi:[ribosomal protein S5]-alanine N-acetyltransferase
MHSFLLETPRLVLREMSLDDLDFVAEMLGNAEVMRFYPKCYSREEAATWIERQRRRYARHGHGLWLASKKSSGRPVGQVGLLIQRADGVEEKEVAYLIHRLFQQQGFATEAALACRDHAFTAFGRERVIALIRPENEPSRKVAWKLGMKAGEHTAEHAGFKHEIFSISRTEWQAMSAPAVDTTSG